jgi:hypothetical protein
MFHFSNSDHYINRRPQCPTAPKMLDLAKPRDAQFVMASCGLGSAAD